MAYAASEESENIAENVNVKRVSRNAFRQAIEDKQVEGWKLKTESDNVAIMEKAGGWGGAGTHILVALFTAWWTFFIGNLIYALYVHFRDKAELQIKTEDQAEPAQAL
ncbi:hypothetical protein [Methanosarcina sp. UBA5]|uniref:hypothetical protein n=1 Tax=Methanosarcina sp. UBA5 TaxID=1915593 RepID=UPI0025F16722|nr:hypothetical protein [Methanosarcina sp. UBA5]